MTTNRKPVVHVVGEYSPSASGPDGRSEEILHFNKIFTRSNEEAGAETFFLKRRSSDLAFGERHISRLMRRGDVVVHLNPVRDLSVHNARRRYRFLMEMAANVVGPGRTVLAMQSFDLSSRIDDGQLLLWKIDYSPIYGTAREKVETVVAPAPEEAFSIVKQILRGENPRVFA